MQSKVMGVSLLAVTSRLTYYKIGGRKKGLETLDGHSNHHPAQCENT